MPANRRRFVLATTAALLLGLGVAAASAAPQARPFDAHFNDRACGTGKSAVNCSKLPGVRRDLTTTNADGTTTTVAAIPRGPKDLMATEFSA